MKTHPLLFSMTLAALLALGACSSDGGGGSSYANNGAVNNDANNGDANNGDVNNGAVNNEDPLAEIPVSFVEEGDAPDCVSGCGNEQDPGAGFLTVEVGQQNGLSGSLDGEEHVFTTQGGQVRAGDIDIIALNAPARSMVELWLTPEGGEGQLAPLLYVYDLFQLITFNGDAGWETPAARTQLIFPWINPLPILIVVEDLNNYENFPGGPFVGGEGYGYKLRWSITPFAPTELGELAAGGTLERQATLEQPGDMHVYRFEAGDAAPTVTVTPSPGADQELELVVSTLTSTQGSAEYGAAPCAEPGASATMDWSDATVDGGERLFVVYDCNGRGGEGFSYTLTVQP